MSRDGQDEGVGRSAFGMGILGNLFCKRKVATSSEHCYVSTTQSALRNNPELPEYLGGKST